MEELRRNRFFTVLEQMIFMNKTKRLDQHQRTPLKIEREYNELYHLIQIWNQLNDQRRKAKLTRIAQKLYDLYRTNYVFEHLIVKLLAASRNSEPLHDRERKKKLIREALKDSRRQTMELQTEACRLKVCPRVLQRLPWEHGPLRVEVVSRVMVFSDDEE